MRLFVNTHRGAKEEAGMFKLYREHMEGIPALIVCEEQTRKYQTRDKRLKKTLRHMGADV